MELLTIRQVRERLEVSARTLRYYEQIGLIQAVKSDACAYRRYTPETCVRLELILLLRKLRLSLGQIAQLLDDPGAARTRAILLQALADNRAQQQALDLVRRALQALLDQVDRAGGALRLPPEAELQALLDGLAPQHHFKEVPAMSDIHRADQILHPLTDVRILRLPPSLVASIHLIGDSPEDRCEPLLRAFIAQTGLLERKPDFRQYGFNHPNGRLADGSDHGYEFWLTIPEDLEVPAPFTRKRFPGGLYAAHMIPMGGFEQWQWLVDWVAQSDSYDHAWGEEACMGGCLEEHLNCWDYYQQQDEHSFRQLDLLLPIRRR